MYNENNNNIIRVPVSGTTEIAEINLNKKIKKINENDYFLYLDDMGTLWVLDKNETINELDYETIENYAEGDFIRVNIEALYNTYLNIKDGKLHKSKYAYSIVQALREESLSNHRILHYAQQRFKLRNN